MKQLQLFRQPWTAALTLGLLGAVTMISMNEFTNRGPIMLISIIVPLILSVLTIKLNESDNKIKKIFLTSFLTYLIILLIYMAYMFFRGNPLLQQVPITGHLKLFGLNLLVAVISCSVLTFLVTRRL